MKKLWLGILATMLVVVFVAPSFAWEFTMTGEYEYRLRYFTRSGNNDLFGQAFVQDGGINNSFEVQRPVAQTWATTTLPPTLSARTAYGIAGAVPATANSNYVGFAGPNYYNNGFSNPTGPAPRLADDAASAGVVVTRGGFSRYGCDALYNDQRLTFVPSIRVNNAIRVHGVYTVGGFRNKYAQNTSDAYGQVSAGTPPFERYYTLQTHEGAYNTAAIGSWEQVRATIQLPLFIISIGAKDFPFGTGTNFANNSVSEAFLMIVPYGPFRLMWGNWLARNRIGAASWETVPDKDRKANFYGGFLFTYDNGPVQLGGAAVYEQRHYNVPNSPTTAYDYTSPLYLGFGKYNNGRFFLNAEYACGTQDVRRVGYYGTDVELYNAFAEGGVMCGPGKLSLMWAQSSGPVLNNGARISSGAAAFGKVYAANPVNYQVLDPYSFLMFPIYGGGNDTFNADGTGQLGDGMVLAARVDYAAAANLNLFGTYMWARRLETAGYWAGGKLAAVNSTTGTVNGGGASVSVASAQAWKAAALGGDAANMNPYPDDNFIGWEAQAGVDWKLLENLSMNLKYSYWSVGPWFDTAYRAFTAQTTGGTGLGVQGQGLMFGRDAIQALHGSFNITF
ncbi:MAG: hypothetical protein WC647_06470 [Desulfomonilaceae bacterium]